MEVTSKVVLVVEYDGTIYSGFQWQNNAPTIQAKLESALERLTGEAVRIAGASRTDAGTHAKGQTVSFRTNVVLDMETWGKALNSHLPHDIVIKKAYEAEDSFDVRRDATSREYAYYILNSPARSPLQERFTHLVPRPLDVNVMNKACQILIGEHDFASFTAPTNKRTLRTVFDISVHRRIGLVIFKMIANSFLPRQIRNTVGSLIKVGLGKIGVEEFRDLAWSGQPGVVGPAAPACGLCLMNIEYSNFSRQVRKDENL